MWRENWDDDTPLVLLDGRNRLDALELLGLLGHNPLRARSLRKVQNHCPLKIAETVVLGGFKVEAGVDPYTRVLSLNVHRRQLTAEQKRKLIAKLLAADPERSNSQIAKTAHADDKTVAAVRRELEGRSEIPNVETRTDTKGRKQPARKWSEPDVATKTKPDAAASSIPHQQRCPCPLCNVAHGNGEAAAAEETVTTAAAETSTTSVVKFQPKPRWNSPGIGQFISRFRDEISYLKRDCPAEFAAICAVLRDVIDEVAS